MIRGVIAAFAVALISTGCSGGDSAAVTMRGHSFEPSTVTVEVGQTVTWKSESDDAHTVTARQDEPSPQGSYFASGGFDREEQARADLVGGLITPNQEFSVTFEQPGTYPYFCIPHEDEGMRGTVVVEG